MHVKPAQGRQVPDPDRGGLLPPEGREVEPTQFWQRRLADGDVVEASQEAPTQPSAAAGKKKEA